MRPQKGSVPFPSAALLLLAASLLLASLALAASPATKGRSAPRSSSQGYDRAGKKEIRADISEILARPEFAYSPSFWQRFLDWLRSLFEGLPEPDLNLDWKPGWGRFLFWFIAIWCGLTLTAILGHVGWRIASVLRRRRRGEAAPDAGLPRFVVLASRPEDELEALRRRLVAEGQFREATSVLMALLLKRLHTRSVLRLHESKTNGDYLVEFPRARPERDAFRGFVALFDGTVYGGADCDRQRYQQMELLFEACTTDVR